MKQKFDVTGMTCSACSAHVENAVKKVKGVTSVNVSLLTNSMIVEYDGGSSVDKAIISAVKKSGYGASVSGTAQPESGRAPASNTVSLSQLIISAVFCVILMYVSMGHMIGLPLPSFLEGWKNALSFALVQLLLCLPVWFVNRRYFIVGFKRLFKGSPNMDTLVALGSAAGAVYAIAVMFIESYALGISDQNTILQYSHKLYFESSSMILALVDLGKYFEGRSKVKTGDALAKLRKLAPDTALLCSDGQEIAVDAKTIKAGDIVIVKAGASFPADGKVVFGNCFADESSISGESLPVEKQIDSAVIGGTVCVGGYVRVQVTTVGQDSVLNKIITLVEQAGTSKAPIQRLADKISAVFVPVVMSISLVTLVIWLCVGQSLSVALDFAVSVLVISCPCALGLATPVAIMVATGKGAENGILVKNGEILERLSSIKQVVADKTGTVTLGKPKVVQFETSWDERKFFSAVGGIERQSEHPLGKAVVEYCNGKDIDFAEPDAIETVAGRGLTAQLDGDVYAIGNKRLMDEQGVLPETYTAKADEYAADGQTCLIVACNGKYVGIIGVGDEIKATSAQAISQLKSLGVRSVMLTGDNALSARAVCQAVGIDEFYAEVLPADKEKKVAELMSDGVTAMVGDGINDAPALTRADIGFAVGSGADIAIDSADVLLVKNDLRDVAYAIDLSKKTTRNIKQNLFWAFFYNALGIPLAAGVLYIPLNLQLNPMVAAAAMSLSSLFVVTNALRLRFYKPKWLKKKNFKSVKNTVKETNTMKYVLKIDGMMCDHCTGRVRDALSKTRGVLSVNVSLQDKLAQVEVKDKVKADVLVKAVEQQGYKVTEVLPQ